MYITQNVYAFWSIKVNFFINITNDWCGYGEEESDELADDPEDDW